jgi:uncharacterized protein (TIGR00730 family)
LKSVAVFCGSKPGADPHYMVAAQEMGRAIARRGFALVYGGGRVGLMGAVADAALAAGGKVIGVIPQKLKDREVAHSGLTRLEVVADMAQRKERMIALSDGFISLPGGLGTLDEMFEVLTLAQLSYHQKPSAILNQNGFYDGLLANCEMMSREGFLYPGVWDSVVCSDTPESLLDLLTALMR